jgi:hypothetical protein
MEITDLAKGKIEEILKGLPGKHLRVYYQAHG